VIREASDPGMLAALLLMRFLIAGHCSNYGDIALRIGVEASVVCKAVENWVKSYKNSNSLKGQLSEEE
jgi:hypothetical protein